MVQRQKLNYDRFYRRMTIGQLWLFEIDGIEYIKLTSPFGSGDEEDAQGGRGRPLRERSRTVEPTPELANYYAGQIARTWGPNSAKMRNAGKVDKKDLPLKVRILIADMEKGKDGRK